ncbi:MAG: imidazole glycerol phosphate synthase subunit HisH [Nitrospirota bacterium]
MIAIIDYGMGNLRSVQKGFERTGSEAIITRDSKQILNADKVVLPGVGAFPDCMRNLERYNLVDTVQKTIQSGKPFLGICLGLQLLFSESEEFGVSKGLDIIKGRVIRFAGPAFETGEAQLKVPHMGWNSLAIRQRPPAFFDVQDSSQVYFVHSYYVVPEDSAVIATTTEYGIEFVSSVWKDNVLGVQFHPEKSQAIGLSLLKHFGEQKG